MNQHVHDGLSMIIFITYPLIAQNRQTVFVSTLAFVLATSLQSLPGEQMRHMQESFTVIKQIVHLRWTCNSKVNATKCSNCTWFTHFVDVGYAYFVKVVARFQRPTEDPPEDHGTEEKPTGGAVPLTSGDPSIVKVWLNPHGFPITFIPTVCFK